MLGIDPFRLALRALAFDEVVLAGRDLRKLEELKASILKDTPKAKVVCSTDYDALLGEMDMIVTSTSGAGSRSAMRRRAARMPATISAEMPKYTIQ